MPPTFLYIIAFLAYSAITAAVLLASTPLALVASTRPLGLKLATGAMLSLPSMLFFQVLSLPLVFLVVLFSALAMNLLSPWPSVQAMAILPVALAMLVLFASASAYGIYSGYRTAWMVFSGSSWRAAIGSDKLFSLMTAAWRNLARTHHPKAR
jgi:hypothetical protein